ncbi:MAG: Lrp/AsnC ligand binding domain-containing protein [Deltaproteobacteria bacterium]|nr:Lrp/AsnC ligand binding domain-containing protein [Deltaproteobacteria bacterium]
MKRGRTKQGVKSFREKLEAEQPVEQRDLGFRKVPVKKIVGSVGRYLDFDSRFRLKGDREPERLERIKEAMRRGKSLPPVELYRIKDEYYVADGNHRVSAAKQFGWPEIDAHILEFLPSDETLENILHRQKSDFEKETGLYDLIELTEVGKYSRLLDQVKEHRSYLEKATGEPPTLASAAKDWYETVYSPLIAMIERSRLLEAFPRRTAGDLYSYISFHQWQRGSIQRYGAGLDQLIHRSMERFREEMMEKKGSEFPEMKRMTTAFLLVNVDTKRQDRIIERLFALEEVKEIHIVPGEFDIIAKIGVERDLLSSDSEVIGQFVQGRVARIPGVTKTQTIIPFSSRLKAEPE